MAKNTGKVFERQFEKSVPDYCLTHRLKDTAQSYNKSSNTRFTWQQPCDYFLFDTIKRLFYCLELKSTKSKSMTFEDIDLEKQQSKMIHKHQILALDDFSKYDNVIAGFMFNFRDEKNNVERTYFQNIKMFMKMYNDINKKSFNEMDLILNGAIKIKGDKKRVHYIWNIDEFLKAQ